MLFVPLMKNAMQKAMPLTSDRVRCNTPDAINRDITRKTENNIRRYSALGQGAIEERIQKLNKEWDIERALQLTSGINVLLGLALGLNVNKKWLLLSAVSSAFLVQHTLQGWCPPLPVLRYFGIRTKEEIEQEKEALEEKLALALYGPIPEKKEDEMESF
jgi:hypothetical protein